MRSYQSHLQTLTSPKTETITQKPVFRASSLFPVIQRNGISTRILFLGYWMLKRNISDITSVITLRAKDGAVLYRDIFPIDEPRSFTVHLSDLVEKSHLSKDEPFIGSLECEFYSGVPMVFPFPATSINYYGPRFSTIVHTAERVYNDYDDMKANTVSSVPESGFNIFVSKKKEPFISLVNGPFESKDRNIEMTFINSKGKSISHSILIQQLKPYETLWINPNESIDLLSFLDGEVGAGKITFEIPGIFPRLLVGNIEKKTPALSITHTYYDCTEKTNDADYWHEDDKEWHAATLQIPLEVSGNHFTRTTFYPIYSPSEFSIDVELYSSQGDLLGSKSNVLELTPPLTRFHIIDFCSLCQELNIDESKRLSARLIARPKPGTKIPARIKLGLDIGNKGSSLPCNICTNLQPCIQSWEYKPHTFKWCPVLFGEGCRSTIWIMNSSQHVNYTREAEIKLTFYRERDSKVMQRQITIPPHGFVQLEREKDEELQKFLKEDIGWMTATSNNPYILTYYFIENESGAYGGDHGF